MLSLWAITLFACGGSKPQTPTQPAPPAEATPPVATAPATPTNPDEAPLPLAPDLKKGVLPNGMTYYIRKHGKPEKRTRLWLAVNAGGMLEDDDQNGLAHFDEHMSFNGTKRFPKNEIINYLQSIGMRFGADLNAYTNQSETVYQLEVPTEADKLARGLDILRDWAGDATYEPGEVKSESGVVLEEWRGDRGADMRLEKKHAKVLYKGTRWADHDVIGDPEILKKADRTALYRFYKDWYRPDNMAVIAVGDFDPAEIEKAIVARFSDLKNPPNERKKVLGGLPKADGTRISIETDNELPTAEVAIHNFIPTRDKASLAALRRDVVESLYRTVMSERYNVLRRRPDAAFTNAFSGMTRANRETDDFVREAQVKNGKVEDALRALLTESARIDRHGITQTELDRAKVQLNREFDQIVDRNATIDSRLVVQEIVRNFLTGELILAPERERDLDKEALAKVTVADINADVKTFGGADNRAIEISVPEGQPKPTAERVKAIIAEVEKADIPAWEDKAIPTALMTTPPKPGKIVKEKAFDKIGVYEWTLSNGAHVILKPTDFEKDAVAMSADSPGGTAVAPDSNFINARFANAVAQTGGVGDFDSDTLTKVLAGKTVSVQPILSETGEGLNASASPKDLETMFQLTYLRITAPRKDEEQFKVWQANSAEQLANQERSPEFQFFKKASEAKYKNNPRRSFPKPEDYAKINLDKSLAFYKDRFGDVADWNFVIVGEFDLAKIRPMVETYLASLPSKGRHEKEKDLGIRKVPGVVKVKFDLGVEPKAAVSFDFHADDKWSMEAERDLYTLGQVVSNLLREELREAKGGTYGVGAFGNVLRSPHQERTFSIQFGCDPTRVDELVTAMNEQLDKLKKDGPPADMIDKVKQIYTRTRETDLRTNRFWTARLMNAFRYGDDPNDITDTSKTLARMTKENIIAAAKKYLDPKSVYEAERLPVEKK